MDLPSGVVTFLMTDIEGSTRLWAEAPEAMRASLARHDAIAASVVGEHAGFLIKPRGEGDSTFSVFARATDAVTAACALQTALTAEPWPETAALRVRIAVHTGEADLGTDDYYGIAVNRCARLRSIAHGGQVLVSESTTGLVREALPEEVTLRDLGYQRLRDLAEPERVSQLLHSALPSDFPALRTIDLVPNNLPYQVSTFIGRDAEMARIRELLRETRLLTLTGAGGVGKTRLALQAAAEMLYEYQDGVWLAELASLSDGDLVAQSVATALDVREEPGRSLLETLVSRLREGQALILLDNCEHLVEACAQLAEHLTTHCPAIRVLATSREALRAEGETVLRVPSLPVPHGVPGIRPQPEQLAQYPAVRLFVDRASRANSGFSVTNENAPAVAEICSRLEGVPLAIELAAARANTLSPEQIEERLDQRFRLLTGGRRTALPRQQTLEATVRWSYELLSETEQRLFARLSVFAGGFTLEAAEAVCSGDGIDAADTADLIGELAAKSLLIPGKGRYWMLETLRAYGRQRLEEGGGAEAVYDAHAGYFADLAEATRGGPRNAAGTQRLSDLDREHGNLRAALHWYLAEDVEAGARLAIGLRRFWELGGHWSEGRAWLTRLLAKRDPIELSCRSDALYVAGLLAFHQCDYDDADLLLREALGAAEEAGNRSAEANALITLGNIAACRSEYDRAGDLYERALAIRRALGDRRSSAVTLHNIALLAHEQGGYAAARATYEEVLGIFRSLGDREGMALTLNSLGNVAGEQGDYSESRAHHEEALALRRELGDKPGTALSLLNLAFIAHEEGDLAAAAPLYHESLAIHRQVGSKRFAAKVLNNLGNMAREQGDFAAARAWLEEGLALFREIGDRAGTALSQMNLGRATLELGDREAARWYGEAAATALEYGDRRVVLACLEGLAIAFRQQGGNVHSATVFGAADALRRETGLPVFHCDSEQYQEEMSSTREAMGEAAFASAWSDGEAMTAEEAVALVLGRDSAS